MIHKAGKIGKELKIKTYMSSKDLGFNFGSDGVYGWISSRKVAGSGSHLECSSSSLYSLTPPSVVRRSASSRSHGSLLEV